VRPNPSRSTGPATASAANVRNQSVDASASGRKPTSQAKSLLDIMSMPRLYIICRPHMNLARILITLLSFAMPFDARAEAGYASGLIEFVMMMLVVLSIPSLFIWLIVRSIRRGKREGHERYKNAEADKAPLGRLGE
jgi:hypothetical protein